MGQSTLFHLLTETAELYPHNCAVQSRDGGLAGTVALTYEELVTRAVAVGEALRDAGKPGDRALLAMRSGLEYVAAVFGCAYAGMIAVPTLADNRGRFSRRFEHVARDADPAVIVSTEATAIATPNGVPHVVVQDVWRGNVASPKPVDVPRSSPALLQYTSGSTSDPRGVMVTHSNLTDNIAHIVRVFELSVSSTVVSWLPLFHDMGLIGALLSALRAGASCGADAAGYLSTTASQMASNDL